LNEGRLNAALLPFLTTALFGPDCIAYWRHCLDAAAEPGHTAPAAQRTQEVETEVADLERRLSRQLLNLEADDVTTAIRRRIADRIAELEAAIADRHHRLAALAEQAATAAPTLADVAPLLDRLPILADRLAETPQTELRALFDKLQLDIAYQPGENALDVALTLYDCDQNGGVAQVRAEDWSVPAGGSNQKGTASGPRRSRW